MRISEDLAEAPGKYSIYAPSSAISRQVDFRMAASQSELTYDRQSRKHMRV